MNLAQPQQLENLPRLQAVEKATSARARHEPSCPVRFSPEKRAHSARLAGAACQTKWQKDLRPPSRKRENQRPDER